MTQQQQQQQQLPNISRIRGVWGDPDVHDLTPTRTSHVKRSFSTDPQKTFFFKTFYKKVINNENAQIKRGNSIPSVFRIDIESNDRLF